MGWLPLPAMTASNWVGQYGFREEQSERRDMAIHSLRMCAVQMESAFHRRGLNCWSKVSDQKRVVDGGSIGIESRDQVTATRAGLLFPLASGGLAKRKEVIAALWCFLLSSFFSYGGATYL